MAGLKPPPVSVVCDLFDVPTLAVRQRLDELAGRRPAAIVNAVADPRLGAYSASANIGKYLSSWE
jgi:hypothetical protein